MQTTLIILIQLGILAFVVILYRSFMMQEKRANEFLHDYYNAQEIKVLCISVVKMKERFKYGIPLIPFFNYLKSQFQIFITADKGIYRTVETSDFSGNEHLRYVELQLEDGSGFSMKEFDVYDY